MMSWSPITTISSGCAGLPAKAGNLRGQKIEGGNIFEGPRNSEYPNNPLIMSQAVGIDPVDFGLVASFNRPGGNITGVAMFRQSPRRQTPSDAPRTGAGRWSLWRTCHMERRARRTRIGARPDIP
jgi:hypothetical protein